MSKSAKTATFSDTHDSAWYEVSSKRGSSFPKLTERRRPYTVAANTASSALYNMAVYTQAVRILKAAKGAFANVTIHSG